MTTITNTPVYSWMLTGIDANLGYLESRYLLAGHMLGIYQYCPGKAPDDEWRGTLTYAYASADEALAKAIQFTEMDEVEGYILFGPTVVAEVPVDHESWAALAAEDEFGSGTGPVLDFVRGVLTKVQTYGLELG